MKFNLWNIVAVGALLYVVDGIMLSSFVNELKATEDYEKVCVMDKLTDGLSTNAILRKVKREITLEQAGLFKYLYGERAVRKSIEEC